MADEPEVVAVPKQCPFLKEPCILDACAVYVRLKERNQAGQMQGIGVCSLPSITMLLSQLNMMVNPANRAQKPIVVPGSGRRV